MDNFSTQPSYSKQKAPFPRKLVFLLLLLILLCAGGFAGVRYMQEGGTSQTLVSPQTTPAEETPTQTPSPTEALTPTPEEKVSTTPSPTSKVTPTKTAGVTPAVAGASTRSSTTVSVLNGSGIAGAASKISTTLKDAGYTIGTVGNAQTFDYTGVTIQVKKSKSSILTQLKTDLSSYKVGSTSATLTESNAADAVVIVGK